MIQHPIAPVYDEHSNILILGSFPSVKSREQGFFYGHPKDSQYYENSGYIREYDVVAIVDECRDGKIYATQRNRFEKGAQVEILAPNCHYDDMTINEMYDENGELVENANHAMMKLVIPCEKSYLAGSIIRMKKDD